MVLSPSKQTDFLLDLFRASEKDKKVESRGSLVSYIPVSKWVSEWEREQWLFRNSLLLRLFPRHFRNWTIAALSRGCSISVPEAADPSSFRSGLWLHGLWDGISQWRMYPASRSRNSRILTPNKVGFTCSLLCFHSILNFALSFHSLYTSLR